jgi:hypothetical protein
VSPLDFSRIRAGANARAATEPRAIFTTLPSKEQRYSYPRDVQSEVWEAWHARRAERDLVVKMNTGGGKTVVGLVMLQSCLAEGFGPVIYITPDVYLTQQVLGEATHLGIRTTTDPGDRDFLRGSAVLVSNIYKVFNGRSVFGTEGGNRDVIELGTVLVDDAHACLSTVAAQFTLNLPSDHPGYDALRELFGQTLRSQSATAYADLTQGDESALMAIPFWAWAAKQQDIIEILHPYRDEDELGFVWPLLAGVLPFCRVAISASAIEIAPPCTPVDVVPSFVRARRRIYLTATLADDSILVTHFGADPASIRRPITPKKADDLGDRMILTPQETFPDTTDETIRDFLIERATRDNVVVIVPSDRRATFWRDVAQDVHRANTLQTGLEALRTGHVGLVVLVNKYDGIDLPGDACRILVLDGLPEARGEIDKLDSRWLTQSDALLGRQIQRIEQGMGRGIRSNDDHCVVLLLGRRLTARLHRPTARAKFSPATKAQLELSDEIADQLRGTSFEELADTMEQCLTRDPNWVQASRSAVVGLGYPEEVAISPIALARREAFDLAQRQQFTDASNRLRQAFSETEDRALRGVLKLEAATYLHLVDPVDAQRLQVSAIRDNRVLPKPMTGVAYVALRSPPEQAQAAAAFLDDTYPTGSDLIVAINALLADLEPSGDPENVEPFEQAMWDLGLHLGFAAYRPERDSGNGPDDLWIGNGVALVIECKSRATANAIPRSDVAQLGHSMDWFGEQYQGDVRAPTPVLVHPSRQLMPNAVAPPGTQIITFTRLAELRAAVQRFAISVADARAFADARAVGPRLNHEHLNDRAFIGHWGQDPRAAR